MEIRRKVTGSVVENRWPLAVILTITDPPEPPFWNDVAFLIPATRLTKVTFLWSDETTTEWNDEDFELVLRREEP